MSKLFKLNLRLFDGGAAAAAGAGEGATAEGGFATQSVQTNTDNKGADLQTEFDGLVAEGGKYKAEFDARVKAAVDKRVKNLKGYEQQVNDMNPVLQIIGERYGVDPRDSQGLANALLTDNAYLEQEAMNQGMTTEQLMAFKRMEYQNRMYQQREAQAKAMLDYNRWNQEAEELKSTLNPGFDFDTELQNPQFREIMKVPGMTVKQAYMAVHGEDMLTAGMRYTAQKTQQNTVSDIIARGTRPQENGSSNNQAVQTQVNVNNLTSEQMKKIRDAVLRGETVTPENLAKFI